MIDPKPYSSNPVFSPASRTGLDNEADNEEKYI